MVTLYDVARLAGVSTATVSRVLHGQDRVRDATRARVKTAIEELGYVPDGAAQSLSRRRKDVIGLICVERETNRNEQNPIEHMNLLYYDEVLRGAEASIRDHNFSLLISFMNPGELDSRRLDSLSGKVDGIVIGEGFVFARYIERLTARVPVVVIAGSPGETGMLQTDVVAADNFSGSAAIVTHLIADHGKRRLFFVGGPPNSPDAIERRLALEHVLRGNPRCQLVGSAHGIYSVHSGELAGEQLLARHRDALPDAVVCGNDQMAIGVLRAFAGAGVRVPDDVAVTGFDDIFPSGLYDPPLSTVHQPMRLLGERASARLLSRIANPDLPLKVELLPIELVLRRSCGCPPGTVTRVPVQTLRKRKKPGGRAPRKPALQSASQAAKG